MSDKPVDVAALLEKAGYSSCSICAELDDALRQQQTEIERLQRAVDEYDKTLQYFHFWGESATPHKDTRLEHLARRADSERQRIAKLAKGE